MSDTTATCCRCSRPRSSSACRSPTGLQREAACGARLSGPLLSAAAYLHVGREASPHNFQLTLALVQCHAALGSVHEATRLYHALGVKHIQQDSLSHLILPPLLRCGALEQAATVLNPAQRFAKDGLRDMPDSLQLAFSSDNYVEALEFVQFEGHLEASWWRRLVVVAAIVHQLPLRLRTAPSQPQPPADALQTALDATTALDGDVSAAALAALPDTLDTTVHESHLPSENGKAVAWMRDVARPPRPPPPRRARLPRRRRRRACGGGVRVAEACGAPAAAEAAAPPAGGDGDGEAEAGEEEEDWASVLSIVRVAVLFAQPAETAAPAAIAAEADALGTLLAGECARLPALRRRGWVRAGGARGARADGVARAAAAVRADAAVGDAREGVVAKKKKGDDAAAAPADGADPKAARCGGARRRRGRRAVRRPQGRRAALGADDRRERRVEPAARRRRARRRREGAPPSSTARRRQRRRAEDASATLDGVAAALKKLAK